MVQSTHRAKERFYLAFSRLLSITGRLVTALAGTVAMAIFPGSAQAVLVGLEAGMLDPTVSEVAAGGAHTCVLTAAGGVRCWGANNAGQLGDNSTTPQPTPVDVPGLSSGVVAIAAGFSHTCALTTAGEMKCWGSNLYGQLGDGSTTDRHAPVDVSGLMSGVVAISAGESHTCALTTSRAVNCWGSNFYGQLGDGSTSNNPLPVAVTGLASGVKSISAGHSHTCAVTTSGGAMCWGNNDAGQLGDGTFIESHVPVGVAGLASGIAKIAAGSKHTCAVNVGGAVPCWGDNANGQLGDGTTTSHNVPAYVPALAASVLSAGDSHNCAISGSFTKCWGLNNFGQIGDGTTIDRTSPVNITDLVPGTATVVGGVHHACAITGEGGLKCWGRNDDRQLGDGTVVHRPAPVNVAGAAAGVSAVSTGDAHTCALTTGGGAKCWGNNDHGEVGDGSSTDRSLPADVSALSVGVASLSTGLHHSCAVTKDDGVKCWGENSVGQLGDNTLIDRLSPIDVFSLSSGAAAVAAGDFHTCALTTGGGVKCWGDGSVGQIGDNTTLTYTTPQDVTGLTSGAAAVAAGSGHTCALTTGGAVKCWGANDNGQIGDASTTTRLVPVDVSGLSSGVTAISAGSVHTCALTAAGGVMCWGANGSGQLGDGSFLTKLSPVGVSGLTSGVAAVSAGANHTCALTTSGGVKCWGSGTYGQLGNFSNSTTSTPVNASGLTTGVAAVAAGGQHTCAVTTGAGLRCWGRNLSAQLGDNTTIDRNAPAVIRLAQWILLTTPAQLRSGVPVILATESSSGGAVTIDTWTQSRCFVAGNSVTAIAPGFCGIRASQPGNGNYSAARRVARILIVAAESALPDFNADGKPDIIWSNIASGATYIWRMNGPALISDSFLATIDPSWKIQGVADFNGDGHPDVVWRNTAQRQLLRLVPGERGIPVGRFPLRPAARVGDPGRGGLQRRRQARLPHAQHRERQRLRLVLQRQRGHRRPVPLLHRPELEGRGGGRSQRRRPARPALPEHGIRARLRVEHAVRGGNVVALDVSSPPIFGIDPVWEVVQVADWNADGKPDLLFRNASSRASSSSGTSTASRWAGERLHHPDRSKLGDRAEKVAPLTVGPSHKGEGSTSPSPRPFPNGAGDSRPLSRGGSGSGSRVPAGGYNSAMKVFIFLLLAAAVAFAWWRRDTGPAATVVTSPAAPSAAIAPPAPGKIAEPPASSTPPSVSSANSALPARSASPASSASPADSGPPAEPGPPAQAPPLRIAVLARIAFAGEPPAITVLLDGHSLTLREGARFGDGFRVDRIGTDRLAVTHVPTQQSFEKRFDELKVPPSDAPAPATAVVSPQAGPFPAASPAARAPVNSAPNLPPAAMTAPATPFRPSMVPAGASDRDNPLVGAVLPGASGRAPPGVSGPRPVPLQPGQPTPAGPQLQPVPPGTQGPVPR